MLLYHIVQYSQFFFINFVSYVLSTFKYVRPVYSLKQIFNHTYCMLIIQQFQESQERGEGLLISFERVFKTI